MARSSRFGCFKFVVEMILKNSEFLIEDTFMDD